MIEDDDQTQVLPPDALLERVIEACDRFEAAWRRGESPRIEDHLDAGRSPQGVVLLRELLALEFELRRARGDTVVAGEYRARFPDHTDVVDAALAEADRPVLRPSAEGPGRFRVVRPLASGGLGRVSVAMDCQLGREVALKEIRPELADRPESRARFLVEAEVTGKLEHPGVVPVYGLGVDGAGRPYYAMRLVQGRTLHQAIASFHGSGPAAFGLEFRKLLGRFVAACDAVTYAHTRGVIHRDLKPANILLGPFGETLVVDWGLAKVVDRPADDPGSATLMISSDPDATATGAALGTPGFMSPEQAAGDPNLVGPPGDVYSLGATLYSLLTGRGPFEGAEPARVLDLIRSGDFPRPRAVDRRVPPALESICLKAMARVPAGRYATPLELADDIERWMADEPVAAHRDGPAERLSRWLRRHRSWAVAVPLASLAVGVIAVLATLLIESERRRADSERDDALRQAARLAYDRAWAAHDGGDYGAGLLWLGRALELTDPGAAREQRLIRTTMNAWRPSVGRCLRVLDHGDLVMAVAIRPDGRALMTADLGGTVRLWDAADGSPRPPTIRHGSTVLTAAFSPDGATIATAGRDGYARLWEAATGRLLRELAMGKRIRAVAFRPDGRALAAGGDDGVRLWKLSGEEGDGLALRHERPVRAVAFRPDGRVLLTGGDDGIIRLWDASSGRPRSPEIPAGSKILSLAVSPDGQAFAVGLENRTAQVRDLAGGRERFQPLRHASGVMAVAFRPDGAAVLTGSWDTTARLWDAATGWPIGEQMRHSHHVRAVAFGPDGATALIGVDEGAWHWSLPRSPLARRMAHLKPLSDIAFRPDGRLLAAGGMRGDIRLWEVATGRQVGAALEPVSFARILAFRPDGVALATGAEGGSTQLWDTVEGRPIGQPMHHTQKVLCLDFRPDGRVLATGGSDGRVCFWDATTGRPSGLELEFPRGVYHLRFSPDGRRMAAGGADGTVRLLDASSGRCLHEWKLTREINKVVFSPDGRIVAAASGDDTARLWDVATGRELARLLHEGDVTALSFRPDGRVVATCGLDGALRLWEASGGRRLAESARSVGAIHCLAFSPDGALVASGADDGAARLWDSTTGAPVGEPFRHDQGVWAVAFSPDGTLLATASADAAARLWEIPTPLAGTAADLVAHARSWTRRELADGDMVTSLGPDGATQGEPD